MTWRMAHGGSSEGRRGGPTNLQRGGGDGGVPVLGEALPLGAPRCGSGCAARTPTPTPTAVLGGRERRDGGAWGDGHGAVRCGGGGWRGWRTRALRTAWSGAAPSAVPATAAPAVAAPASTTASATAAPALALALGVVAEGGRRA